MTEQKIAAAYIRVSTDDQLELSPDSQLAKIREYAEKNGYILPQQYIFHDDGISGRAAEKRAGFQQMIATAKAQEHPFDLIIVWKYSRFARNQEESIFYKSILRSKCNVDVVSVSEPLIAGPFGSLIERIIEWMDEFYSIRLSEEVKRSMIVNAKNGNLQTTASFGYKNENKKLVIVPEEAEIIREIFERFIAGEAMFAISQSLNARGVKTHRGNSFENRTVDYILNNPVYIGKLRWTPTGRTRRNFKNPDSIVSDAQHEAIIDIDTWDAAQQRCQELKAAHRWHGKPASERKHWLCGIVRCPTCGSTLVWQNPHYMVCNKRLRGACPTSQHIPAVELEKAFLDVLQHDMIFSGGLSFTVERLSSSDTVRELKQKRTKIANRMARLREAYLDGAETLEDYKAARQRLQMQIDSIDAEIEKGTENEIGNPTAALQNAIAGVLETLQSDVATVAQKYEAATSIIEKCYFDRSQMLLTISYKLTV